MVTATTISSTVQNNWQTELDTGLTNCIAKDGQSATTARIPFASGVGTGNGTVAAPAYNFTSDTGSGLYRIGTNNLGVAINGVKVADIAATSLGLSVHLLFSADATYDIGASGATRPRDLFLSRNMTVGGTATISGHITTEGVTATGATGTGKFVFDTSPTLVTPTLGVATGTRLGLGAAADGSILLFLSGGGASGSLQLQSNTAGGTAILHYGLVSASNTQYSTFYSFRGTIASPTQVLSGDVLDLRGVYAYDNTPTLRLQGFTGWKTVANITTTNQSYWAVMNASGTDIFLINPSTNVATVASGTTFNIAAGGSTAISTGTGTVKMTTANNANNAAWIPVAYAGTTYYVPGWTTHAP